MLAALAWQLLMEAHDEARAQVPGHQWLRVRYEDIVADPRGRLTEVLDHLGLGWTPRFESGFARYDFGSGRTEAFRRDLAPADVKAMEEVLGDSLSALGY